MNKTFTKSILISVAIGLATAILAFSLLYIFTPPKIVTEENKSIFDPPKNSEIDINSGNFIDVNKIGGEYIAKTETGRIFLKPTEPHLAISGFPMFEENGNIFYRLNIKDKSKYNAGVQTLAYNTSGGRIRFKTNSTKLVINVTLQHYTVFMHMPMTGIAGLDIYTGTGTNKKWLTTVFPESNKSSYTATVNLGGAMQEVCINLPLYAGIQSIEIGFDENSKVGEPTPYKYEKPVVFYGSSITQGGCASRPGTSYSEMVTRWLDANLVNLGFSGSALGEPIMAEFIANLEMSAFVLDYDHNAPSVKVLKDTHYNFYKTIRDKNPDLPIIILSKSDVLLSQTDENAVRRKIIKETYDKAVADGDKNVYFISGDTIYGQFNRDVNMVDGCHPNDLGFYRYAETLYPILKEVLEKASEK